MKLFTLAATGLVALTGLAPVALTTAASAQDRVVTERTVVRTSHRDYGHRFHGHRMCRTEWRHHHRVRICR